MAGSYEPRHAVTAQKVAGLWPLLPRWLRGELRSDHAGETGAVWIYRGAAAGAATRSLLGFPLQAATVDFVRRHLLAEEQHLRLFDIAIPFFGRSMLLVAWRAAGWVLGCVPALVGNRALFLTIDAVETFVEDHYGNQIVRLKQGEGGPHLDAKSNEDLIGLLGACCEEEIYHRDDARTRWNEDHVPAASAPYDWNPMDQVWVWLVLAASASAAWVAKKI